MQQAKLPKQHRNVAKAAAKHPQNPRPLIIRARAPQDAPLAVGSTTKMYFDILPGPKKYPGSVRIRGKDYLGTVVIPGGSWQETQGAVYQEFYISPAAMAGTRLEQFSKLYDKYLFNEIKFSWVPAVPATVPGTVGLAYDRDIDDPTPPSGIAGLRTFTAFQDNKSAPCWQKFVMDTKLDSPETGFYCDENGSEDRTAYQGQLYVFCESPTGQAPGAGIGNVHIEFDVILYCPQLDNAIPNSGFGNPTGTTNPSATDVLLPFATTSAGSVYSPNSALGVIPQPAVSASKTRLSLYEGTYRIGLGMTQQAAGLNNLMPIGGKWSSSVNEPAVAQAPQLIMDTLFNVASTAAAGKAFWETLVSVPKGGGKLWLDAPQSLTAPGVAAPRFTIQKVANWLDAVGFAEMAANLQGG